MAEQKENRFSGMTPEEIRLEAKRQIVRSAFLALAALIVIGVACYAWFANNRSVSANLSEVSLNADCFELASKGDEGQFDGYVDGGETGIEWSLSKGNTSIIGTQTGLEKQTILWRMDSNSHIGNQKTSGKGIRPGSSGALEFYVIPKQNRELTLNFRLDITPYKANTNQKKTVEIAANSPVWQLIRGHLLFICEYTANGSTTRQLVDLSDGHFQVVVPSGTDTLSVKLDWCWPYLLSDAVVFDKDCVKAENGKTVKEWILESLTKARDPQYFFAGNGLERYIGRIDSDTLEMYLKRLGEFYNKADQLIGDNVDCIVLCLTAEAV